jgi:hypothetical protein
MKKKTKGEKIIRLHLKGYKAKEISKKTKAKIGYVYSAISLYNKQQEKQDIARQSDEAQKRWNKYMSQKIAKSLTEDPETFLYVKNNTSLFTKIKRFFGM